DTTPRVLYGDHQPNSHASGHGIPDRREERCSPTTALTGQPFLPDSDIYCEPLVFLFLIKLFNVIGSPSDRVANDNANDSKDVRM
ncbi:hypothetical protein DPMN_179047, partial [Dreissena polymorpha]